MTVEIDKDFLAHSDDLLGIVEEKTPIEDLLGEDSPKEAIEDLEVEKEVIDEPVVKEEKVVDTQTDADDRDAIIQQLREEIQALAKGEVWPSQPKPDSQTSEEVPPTQQVATAQPKTIEDMLKEVDYLSEDELDAIIDDPKLINKAINRARADMVQTIAQSIPQIVGQAVQQQLLVQRVVQSFYEQNEDLLPYSDFVKFKMTTVEKANPNLTYQEIFERTATECRKGLGLKNPGDKKRDETTGMKPGFTAGKKTSVQRPVDQKPDIFDVNALDLLNL